VVAAVQERLEEQMERGKAEMELQHQFLVHQ
jgi:hypothetical protein